MSILVEQQDKLSTYFEYEQSSTEPCMFHCLNTNTCTGKFHTPHGYYLKCLRCESKGPHSR